MDKNKKEEISATLQQLKKNLTTERETLQDIHDLVKTGIDRDYPVDFWELSPRELDDQMGRRLSFLNDDIDTRPDATAISSHRRIIGKPIVLFKKIIMKFLGPYTNSLLDKQRAFNEQLVAYHLATFVRFKHLEQKVKEMEERIKDIEENQELVLDELKKVK